MIAAARKRENRSTAEEQWQYVLTRDARHDGEFVFAVTTTGVYCRPSCPARKPRRENVRFFEVPELAEQAGFRGCLRCKPNESQPRDPKLELVRRVCQIITSNNDGKVSLQDLATELGRSPFYLQRTFKSIMGVSPKQFAEAFRADRFRAGVRNGDSIAAAMYDAGYGSSSRLYERAGAELGMTPAKYKRRGEHLQIKYSVAESDFGMVLVAATDKGVCAVRLGDDEAELERELREEYSAATIDRSDRAMANSVNQILGHLGAKAPTPELPLDVRATAFQRQVWEALRQIPYGETRSYGDVANAIGQPRAVRAVARACATNPLALLVPCHRVIRGDKSLGGYRWGVDRKRKLLDQESSRLEIEDPISSHNLDR